MAGKTCPLLKSKCIGSDCEWFLDDVKTCALVALANNLWGVTYPQGGGGSIKVVDG
ncbi:MAG: hypothetical protein GQ567_00105 [Methanosarcinales archaeon]|jgi:hypothetical protein|nr:hypothetical protein [Methanosarcinales archaeon]